MSAIETVTCINLNGFTMRNLLCGKTVFFSQIRRGKMAARRAAIRFVFRLFSTLVIATAACTVTADDIELYEHGGCPRPEAYRFIFIVDNSGSMSSTDFNNSKATVNVAISHVLNSGLDDVKVAVVQYGTSSGGGVHDYNVTVPFTADNSTATNWSRDYGSGGTYLPSYYQDHQPGSLAKMRRDDVYAEGGLLDVSDATNVQFVFFTDAWRDYYGGCCSSIVAQYRTYIPSDVKQDFGEYDVLKDGSVLPNGLKGQFTLLHAAPNGAAMRAGAAIASVGGEYTGSVESNSDDPDGASVGPRRYILGDLSVSDSSKIVSLLDTVFEEISVAATLATPSVSTSASNDTRHSDKLYFSLFQPGDTKSWAGNIKNYRISDDGVIVDAVGVAAMDSETGVIQPTSRSLWSSEDDGREVTLGGYAAQLAAPRNWFTDVGGVLAKVTSASQVPASAFGISSNSKRNDVVNWAIGWDSLDLNENTLVNENNHYIADSLHTGPLMVNYWKSRSDAGVPSRDVLFTASNLGVIHAIDPITGAQYWSYTPEELLPNLLAFNEERLDINDHNYGMDGPLSFYRKKETVSSSSITLNKGYLYASQRRGGSGIFALDVGRAREDTEPFKVAWKISGGEGAFKNLGQSWSKPAIVTVNDNCDTACEKRDVLLFSGGYNPLYDDASASAVDPSMAGHGNAIYMVDPVTGALLWSAGKGGSHDLSLDMKASIPSEPVVIDTDGDGAVNIIYVVDIDGVVWRIDLDPRSERLSALHLGGGKIADLKGAEGTNFRFFNRPDVVMSVSGSSAAHFKIMVGSGMRNNPLLDEPAENSFYFIRDPWVNSNPVSVRASDGNIEPNYQYVTSGGGRSIIKRGDLARINGLEGALASSDYGYFYDMEETAEKILAPSLTYGGKTLLLSYVPPDGSAAESDENACAYALGVSKLYVFDQELNTFITLPNTEKKSIDVSAGIVSQLTLVDTGGSSGVGIVAGFGTLIDLDTVVDIDQNNMRRIRRTSWIETQADGGL